MVFHLRQSFRRPTVASALTVAATVFLSTTIPLTASAAGQSAKTQTFVDAAGEVLRSRQLPDAGVVQLSSGAVDVRRLSAQAKRPGNLPKPMIVALEADVDAAASLRAAGAQLVGPLPPAAFLVRLDGDTAAKVEALPGFVGMTHVEPQWKLSPRLPAGPIAAEVEVVLFEHSDPEEAVAKVESLGELVWISKVMERHVIGAVLDPNGQASLAALDSVEMVDVAGHGSLMNNEVRVVMQTEKQHFTANQAFYNPIYNLGVWGAGQIVTLADTGLNNHEVFVGPGKILAQVPAPNSCVTTVGDGQNHGTGVAATLLGDSLGASGIFGTANNLDGLAIRSTLAMLDIVDAAGNFCPPSNYQLDLFFPAWQVGSMVHSNSWGHNAVTNMPMGTYSWRSQMIDDYMSRPLLDEQVILFAAGNAGATFPGNVYMPYSLSDEAHSKNAIAVGGSGNGNARDLMYLYSSRGPTDDCLGTPCPGIQRVKPDVLAPADLIVNTADTASFTAYSAFSGTSIAAPAVAAASALIRDYFAQGIYPVNPSDPKIVGPPGSDLVKAMLVNATVPIYDTSGYQGNLPQGLPANAYPNYDQGYGRPVLDNVLDPAGYRKLKVFQDDSTEVNKGDVWQRGIKFKEKWGASCNTLRVTLAWNDPEATLAAGPKLVNDLDLEVIFNGVKYRGNHRLTGNNWDTVNNVEDVMIPTRDHHLYSLLNVKINVYGTSVPIGPQTFAVVATYGACADNIPCPPNPPVGGCYRGPGDVVPGSNWTPTPGCGDQVYSNDEYDGMGNPYPFCEPPGPIDVEPVGTHPGGL